MYDIRLASSSEGDALAHFIDQHWKAGHVFAVNRKLLDWQHLDQDRGVYNFVIGVHTESGEIHGILGFIPLSQFDTYIDSNSLVWMAIWKVRDEARGHRLGRRLMDFLEETEKPKIISTVAASAMTLPMYQAKGYQTGQMKQYFVLNVAKRSFNLVDAEDIAKMQPSPDHSSNFVQKLLVRWFGQKQAVVTLRPISELSIQTYAAKFFDEQTDLPVKTALYIVRRYFRHPFYKYLTYEIDVNGVLKGVLILRVCTVGESRALRIVDFVGPSSALAGLQDAWQKLLREHDAEYVDFCCAGISDADLRSSGFLLRQEIDGLTLPHYFEPFYKKNIEIDYMISLPIGTPHRIVKGDSDQDRPNVLAERAR